ncbi:hypothetical protein SS31_10025 [Pluralibacter gergoviae]|nr:hypothetical protein SS31_10025 [Pluralibacter gergoviae]
MIKGVPLRWSGITDDIRHFFPLFCIPNRHAHQSMIYVSHVQPRMADNIHERVMAACVDFLFEYCDIA